MPRPRSAPVGSSGAMQRLLLCTGDRFVRLGRSGPSWDGATSLEATGAQCLAADPDGRRVLVGTRGSGALLSLDGGDTWRALELPERDVFSVAISPADGALYAGTEPSRLFRSRDDGRWQELTALQEIPSRERWSFPPRPWTSHVRWIAPDPHRAERLLVGIELGGLMRTDDGGESFSAHRPGAQPDVHSVVWHPRAEDRAYEAGGGGAAWSRDGGLSWEGADAGRELHYCWAVAPDPGDPDRWYVSAARGPFDAHGRGPAGARLYRWEGDGPWEPVGDGPLESMPYALVASDGELLVGLADGRVLRGADRGERWERLPVEVGSITAMVAR
jgi:hypothetical protein